MRNSPSTNFKELRRRLPRDYAWLLQNDYDWLNSHSPRTHGLTITASGIDWKARDIQYAVAVKASVHRLRNVSGRPVRVTRTAIGRDLGAITLLRQKLHRMPLTTKVLAGATETWEEYAIRRVQWAANLYLRENLVPQGWQLELRANVYRYKDTKGVRDAIYSTIQMLESELSLLKAATA